MKFSAGISGTRSAVIKDFKFLEESIDQYELAPWHHKEIDLISRNHDVTAENQLYSRVEHGQFYSIYQEPIMAFAMKEYTENDRRLAVVKFNDKKYHFNVLGQEVELLHQDRKIGEVSVQDGLQIKMNGHKLHIDANTTSGLIPLSIDDKHTLSIAAEDEFAGASGRMLHKIHETGEEESELILISIAFALANKQI